jgi:hypothetical protein
MRRAGSASGNINSKVVMKRNDDIHRGRNGSASSGERHVPEAIANSRAQISTAIEALPRWDVRIVCEDSQTGDFAFWLLQKILPSTGLNVSCETQIINIGCANAIALFQGALLEAANADFVILSLRGTEGMQPGTKQLVRHWVRTPEGRTCPVAVLLNPTHEFAPGRYDVLTKVQELCADISLPFFNSLYSALMEAWEQFQINLCAGRRNPEQKTVTSSATSARFARSSTAAAKALGSARDIRRRRGSIKRHSRVTK